MGDGLVVDVGGAEGFMSIVIAEKYPSFNFIVQELLEVAKNTQKNLPNSLTGRVKFEEHDFFTEQTITADVYLFRQIFHDYPNDYCVKILRQLIPTLKPGTRILLVDNVVPEPGIIPASAEKQIR